MNRITRLQNEMTELQWDAVIVSSVPLIRYFTGFFPDLETGHNPFEPGPVILRIDRSGENLQGSLLIPEDYTASVDIPWIECIPYIHYDVLTSTFDRRRNYADVVRKLAATDLKKAKIGIEKNWLPSAVMGFVGGDTVLEDCGPMTDKLRLVKDEDERTSIKAAVNLANIGQHAVRRYARESISEIELFGLVKTEMEKYAGQRIPLLADFVSGPRTSEIGGLPGNRILSGGDLVLTDLVPNWNGYWGDSCSVTSVGTPGSKMLEAAHHIRHALELAKEMVKPGVHVQEIDRAVKAYLSNHGYAYPHHTGHGIGLQYHEGPLISANGNAVLEENMVIAIEPGAYSPDDGFGIRLEDVLCVTKDGFEQWTDYPKTLE